MGIARVEGNVAKVEFERHVSLLLARCHHHHHHHQPCYRKLYHSRNSPYAIESRLHRYRFPMNLHSSKSRPY